MSLKDNPLVDKPTKSQQQIIDDARELIDRASDTPCIPKTVYEAIDEARDVIKQQEQDRFTAYGTVTPLTEEYPTAWGNVAKRIGMFLLESFWTSVQFVGSAVVGIGAICMIVVVFVCTPVLAFAAFSQGHWILGIIFTLIAMTAWGAVLNEKNR